MSHETPNDLADTKKRDLLKALSLFLGASATSQILNGNALGVARAYEAKPTGAMTAGQLLNRAQMQNLRAVCQTIIPATDTLGAGDVGVHDFIDNQLVNCYSTQQQNQFLKTLNSISSLASVEFSVLAQEKQHELLSKVEDGTIGSELFSSNDFRFIKWLTVFGYFTSEEGASKVLKYLPFPGDFKGSVPYESVGKAFGSLAYY